MPQTFAQITNCDPEMHGVKLGMSVTEVKKRLPFMKISAPDNYQIRDSFLYVTSNKSQRNRLPRVFNIELLFLNDSLVRYIIKYYGSDSGKSVYNFTNQVINGFCLTDELKVSNGRYVRENIQYSIGEDNQRSVVLLDLKAKEIIDKSVYESYTK